LLKFKILLNPKLVLKLSKKIKLILKDKNIANTFKYILLISTIILSFFLIITIFPVSINNLQDDKKSSESVAINKDSTSVFYDNFEANSVGSFPTGWSTYFSGSEIEVVASPVYSGSRALKLQGGASWVALIYNDNIPDVTTDFLLECYFYCPTGGLDDENSGRVIYKGIGTYFDYVDKYNVIVKRGDTKGTVKISANTWHHLEIYYDWDEEIQVVYVDGEFMYYCSAIISTLGENGGNRIFLGSGNDGRAGCTRTIYFDDVNLTRIDEGFMALTLYDPVNSYSFYVEITIYGNEYFYGECIDFYAQQKTSTDICIIIEKGTTLIPSTSYYQNMIVAKTYCILLKNIGEIFSSDLYGFCGEIHDNVPTSSISFSIDRYGYSSSSNVYKVLTYLESHSEYLDTRGAQCAIWACTDGPSEVTSDYWYHDDLVLANKILKESGTGLIITPFRIPGFTFIYVLLTISTIGLLIALIKSRIRCNKIDIKI